MVGSGEGEMNREEGHESLLFFLKEYYMAKKKSVDAVETGEENSKRMNAELVASKLKLIFMMMGLV